MNPPDSTSLRQAVPPAFEPLEPRLLFSASALPGDPHLSGPLAEMAEAAGSLSGALPTAGATDATGGSALRAGGGFALSEVPALHSNPGATQSIFLDFNGMTVTGTVWNTSQYAGGTIHAPAFDLDGDVTTFTDVERDQMIEVWQRVSEDFAPFDLDVTTVEPPASHFMEGARAIRILISSNINHADLGGDGEAWTDDAGGIARRNSWRFETDTPAWVFSNLLLGSAKNVAEAVSHEAGHTFGLGHDGTDQGEEYYAGHGSGATSWAPIMGASYDPIVTQWSRGEYDHADNSEDDLAVITQPINGVSFRADDHADTRADASHIQPLLGTRSIGASGLIATTGDVDYFSFDADDGLIQLSIRPAAVGANLDILARLYDESGAVVATSNPSGRLDASFGLTVEAGRYYLSVQGTGAGDPGDSGYSDYGSLGHYHLVGSVPPSSTVQLPTPIAGDVDGDFVVGGGDLSLVIASFGETGVGLPADANDDGAVNAEDLDMVLANWGDAADPPAGGTSRVLVPTDGALGLDWIEPGFDDDGWAMAVPAVGYETSGSDYEPLLTTHLPGGTLGAYLRSTFQTDDPETLAGMGLAVRYDDGFVAYLNGERVASANAPDDPAWDDRATHENDDDDAKQFAWFDLSGYMHLLEPGDNTLAVHVMNRSSGSSDLLIEAEVVAWSSPAGAAALASTSDPDSTSSVRAGGLDLALAPDPGGATKKDALAAWAQKRAAQPADALAPAKPGPKRGTATTPRHVADLLR